MTNQNKYGINHPEATRGKHPKDLHSTDAKKQKKTADPNIRNRLPAETLSQHPIGIYYDQQRNLTLDPTVPLVPVEAKGGHSTPTVEMRSKE